MSVDERPYRVASPPLVAHRGPCYFSEVPARFLREYLAASLVAVLSSWGTAVAQGPLHVSLDYSAPDNLACPGELDVRSAIVARLDYDPFLADASRTVSVEISATGGVLSGLLQWRDGAGAVEGERRFASSDSDCAELAKNMGFAITVQLQLLNTSPGDSPAPETPKTEPETTAELTTAELIPPRSRPVAPSSPRAKAHRFDLGGGAGPYVAFGWSPMPLAGGNAFFIARNQAFSAQVGFEMSLSQSVVRGKGSGFETSVLAASVAPCMRFGSAEACSVLRLGQVRARGFGVDEPRAPRATFSEVGLRLGLEQAIGASFEGKTHIEVACTLSPWKVQLNGAEAFAAPSFVLLMGFDLVAFFL